MTTSVKSYLLTAAIDFGTTYSGYAYSHQDEKNIQVNTNWKEGSQSFKVPTAVLFDDRKNLLAFGYDAEDKYSILAEDVCEHEDYFFYRFIMELYKKKNLTRDFKLTSKNGKEMPAIDVISGCIELLKQSLIDSLNSSQTVAVISAKQIKWVLTVPAISSDKAKLFMKDAAIKAGIADEDLIIALEPECASVFCKTLPAGKLPERFSNVGAKYMVIDLGGETVDITIHETTNANGNIKGISNATGNDGGGTNVDRKFEEFLRKILSENVVKYAKEKFPAEWLELERNFESVKRNIRSDNSNEYVMINLYSCLDDAYEAYNEMTIRQAFQSGDIEFPGVAMKGRRRLKIIRSEIQSMISDVAETIIQPIETALRNSRDLDYVILAGGFSNSDIVREKLRRLFNPTPVVCPNDGELAVVRGAVLYGLRSNQIRSHVSQRTCNLDLVCNFCTNDSERPAFCISDNEKYCDDVYTMTTSVKSYLLTAAIDFGTTYSGYAYSHQDERNIHVNANWKEGSQSFKVPMAALFDDQKNLLAFGYDAEDKYSILAEDVREHEYYFFHRFKMELYNEKNLTKDIKLTSKNGKEMAAIDVISGCIEFLKQSLLNSLNSSQTVAIISAKEIKWILTVPAISSDKAKLFMKDAAIKAGIADEDLIIALEPECASVFCKTLSAGKLPERFSKYMVVDLEGETVDITIVETQTNGNIKEISKATGNYTNVYLKFEEFLGKILTENVVEYVKEKYPAEWLELERNFESVKRSIRSNDSKEYVIINLSSCLDEAYEAFNEMTIAQAFKSGDIEFPGVAMQGKQRLKIIRSEIQSMISDVAETIIQPIENALGNSRDLDYVILVGGFSNSDIVREKLQRFFYPTPLICPEEEECAVLRGAVLYGLRRNRVL